MNKTLFLDRDGIINKMVKYSYGFDSPQKAKDVDLVEGIDEIIKWANLNQILVVVISNQPVIAKGKMTQQTFNDIENMIDTKLRVKGAAIDHKFYCFHHPDSVIKELRQNCDCRKPQPGLLYRASSRLAIDISESIFLGDGAPDALAGAMAGCKTIIYLHDQNDSEKVSAARDVPATLKISRLGELTDILVNHYLI